MPIPLGPVIAAGGSILSQGINAITQGNANKKNRQFALDMYNRQRQDALSDWAMTNEYNSPAAMMARYKAAGLNKNLIYGQTNDAAPVRSSQAQSYDHTPAKFDVGSTMGQYFDTKFQGAQLDNLRTQQTVMQQEALLKSAQIASTTAATARSKFDLRQAEELSQYVIDAAKAGVNKTLTETQVMLDRNEREAAMNSANLRQAAEQILIMRKSRAKTDAEINHINQQIKNLKADEQLKQYEIDLNKRGIQKGDPLWFRKLADVVDDVPSVAEMGRRAEANDVLDNNRGSIGKFPRWKYKK